VHDLTVKIRHGKGIYRCQLLLSNEHTGKVILESHDQGLASGQFAVFYDGDYCLGSGMIE
jgi:tRNA-specific 2-thiouridylase